MTVSGRSGEAYGKEADPSAYTITGPASQKTPLYILSANVTGTPCASRKVHYIHVLGQASFPLPAAGWDLSDAVTPMLHRS